MLSSKIHLRGVRGFTSSVFATLLGMTGRDLTRLCLVSGNSSMLLAAGVNKVVSLTCELYLSGKDKLICLVCYKCSLTLLKLNVSNFIVKSCVGEVC